MKTKLVKTGVGFTLIELLVVISIIGLLASVILIALNGSRIKARDAKRLADIKQIRTALDLYFSDYGHYPISTCSNNGGTFWVSYDDPGYSGYGTCDVAGAATTYSSFSSALSNYIKGSVADPKHNQTDSGYIYHSPDGVDFKLIDWAAPENMNDFPSGMIDTAHCTLPITASGQCTGGGNTFGFWSANGAGY